MTEYALVIFKREHQADNITVPYSRDLNEAASMCARTSDPHMLRLAGALGALADLVRPFEPGHTGSVVEAYPPAIADVPRCPWCPVPDAPDSRYHPDDSSQHHELTSDIPRKLLRAVDPLTCQHPLTKPTLVPIDGDPVICVECQTLVWPVVTTLRTELDALDDESPDDVGAR